MKITVGTSAEMKKASLKQLPDHPAENRYRFFCKILRENFLDKTITLYVDGTECTFPASRIDVGLREGRICVDMPEAFARKHKLI